MSLEDQVIDFYRAFFGQIFSDRFRPEIADRLRRDAVVRQIEDAADAASQSLTRFFLNEQMSEAEVASVLSGFDQLASLLTLEKIATPNLAPESVVEELLAEMPCPRAVRRARQEAFFRVALHSIVQVSMLVGRVMAEWQQLKFSSAFEMPRRVAGQLNTISERINALGTSGQAAADERFELTYRDYLLQRFYRVEAGTVRMTTNMDVDLRELFVMPRVRVRRQLPKSDGKAGSPAMPMDLAAARILFGARAEAEKLGQKPRKEDKGVKAITQIKRALRNVIVGTPGSGKSTLFEWLQLKIAGKELKHILGGGQAIPLLLRVRQLIPKKLPRGAALIESAMASKDRAALMPNGWLERQMKAGRVLFMLDGLDETEPELCDNYIIPWLAEMCDKYPMCGFLISSRPVGYPPGALLPLGFKECDLLDFGDPEIAEYVRHWCTAIRLALKESEEEARREGTVEGEQIVEDFKRNPYVKDLARNPLMLSAVCLVNYFESGKLPEDRALLYKLCVEGLLHHWDSRRGIRSEFTLSEKLHVCREVAIAMQAEDRAEYEVHRVQRIISVTLGDPDRAKKLLEHIRYRTGLLIERCAGMFAFAHLTFQEYLAAQAVYEGNRMKIDARRLAREHNDGRWKEVIALYCGSSSEKAARAMIKQLISQPNSIEFAEVLAEAYFSSGPRVSRDCKLRLKVLERISLSPAKFLPCQLERFPEEDVAPIATAFVGKGANDSDSSEAYNWLLEYPSRIEQEILLKRLQNWKTMKPFPVSELVYLLHLEGGSDILMEVASDEDLYRASGPVLWDGTLYKSQAEIALYGLVMQIKYSNVSMSPGAEAALLKLMQTLARPEYLTYMPLFREISMLVPKSLSARREIASLVRQWQSNLIDSKEGAASYISILDTWIDVLEKQPAGKPEKATKTGAKPKSKKSAKRR
jgi:hypothetical protein